MTIRASSKMYSVSFSLFKKPLQAYLCIFVDSVQLFTNPKTLILFKECFKLKRTYFMKSEWHKYPILDSNEPIVEIINDIRYYYNIRQ